MPASIIICAYKRLEDRTIPCVSHVLTNTRFPYELILVDDGSKDQTCRYFRSVTGKAFCLPENRGPGVARNVGLRNAAGDPIVFLDNDVEPHTGWLKSMIDEMRRSGVDILAALLSHDDWKLDWKRSPDGLIDVDWAATACLVMTRRVFDAVGYFDEDLSYSSEDVDYCFRAKLAGFRLAITPKIRVKHRPHSTLTNEMVKRQLQRFREKWRAFGYADAQYAKIPQQTEDGRWKRRLA